MIKVSVIVPVYNAAVYIERCIDSVIDQSYGPIECIFIDDCTADNSILLIKEKLSDYTGSIDFRIFYHEKNLGAAAARNFGIRKATGDYIYFLDSDDMLFKHCLNSLVHFVDQYPNIDMVLADMECEDPVLNKVFTIAGKNLPCFSDDIFWIHTNFLINIPVSPCNKLIRSDLIRDNHVYFKEGIVNEDVLWMFFLSKYVCSISFCSSKTYYYHHNRSSVTTSVQNEEKRIISWLVVIDTYLENIDPYVKWIESFNALKLLHHVRLKQFSPSSGPSFQKELKMRIKFAMVHHKSPFIFKLMYLLLLSPQFLLQKMNFIWKKCLGVLYRIAIRQDRKLMKGINRN